MELGFLNSSNDIIYDEIDEIPPDNDKVTGNIEPENKINDYAMEMSEDDGKDIEQDPNSESDVWSEYTEHEVFDIDEPDLE